ncbi:aminopeptidase P family protein [Tsukamurella sp. 8F]|uniref:M24 family metallopeptidase n=1 Tax=unclassified Tsukamurella TaxID=2633480 RepID=UPI0023B9EE6C|nr:MULTISPECIES: aminopeptidase P family protein [unclassified Tsukamurella]MDF0531086.1 aminopeptidase P family protein [Tsukamurella sp. 8J]MDF0585447.1 aminopeptidase P family protein [Tsukamurella sp. 8F]
MPETHARRRAAARAALGDTADALLVTDLVNIRYLTGFTGSNAALLIDSEASGDVVATDGRYTTQISEQAPDLEAIIERDCAAVLLGRLAAGRRVAFEAANVSVAAHGRLAGIGPALVATQGLVEGLREVKDADEVALIARACAISDEGLAALIQAGGIVPGRTEKQVARQLENLMLDFGAEDVAFETIVAAGAHSAIPHHRPTQSVLRAGDFVKIDFGAKYSGYHADITRTFVLGEPAAWQLEVYDLVRDSQRAGRQALAPGADARAVDGAARAVIADAGYGEHFVHGLGHGVGLEIHEAPSVGSLSTGTLSDGAVVTVEPGVYLPGRGGVRIEDTLVVRSGGPELLTHTAKDLITL